ncbi:MAG: S8 family serine peptidase, partial [Verrucomicrobiota bacterium]
GVNLDEAGLNDRKITAYGEGDPVGHGTSVISLLAGSESALRASEIDVATDTPAYYGLVPEADILSYQVFADSDTSDAFSLAAILIEAVDAGADVINMSLGGYGDNPVLRYAVDYAHERGAVVVAAAGNDGASTVVYPAAYPNTVAVGSTDGSNRVTSFSNYGEAIDVAAPGSGVPVINAEGVSSLASGTSFSAPIVTAAIAMTLQTYPQLTPQEAAAIVITEANDTQSAGPDIFTGEGVVNFARILDHGSQLADIAVASQYIDRAASDPSALQVNVVVENRGTQYLSNVQLEVSYEGRTQQYYLGGLNPSESRAQPILLNPDLLETKRSTEITSQASINLRDARPENDIGHSAVVLPERAD